MAENTDEASLTGLPAAHVPLCSPGSNRPLTSAGLRAGEPCFNRCVKKSAMKTKES